MSPVPPNHLIKLLDLHTVKVKTPIPYHRPQILKFVNHAITHIIPTLTQTIMPCTSKTSDYSTLRDLINFHNQHTQLLVSYIHMLPLRDTFQPQYQCSMTLSHLISKLSYKPHSCHLPSYHPSLFPYQPCLNPSFSLHHLSSIQSFKRKNTLIAKKFTLRSTHNSPQNQLNNISISSIINSLSSLTSIYFLFLSSSQYSTLYI